MNSKGYMRHSGMAYFPGGIDSCNTEASLISSGRKYLVYLNGQKNF